jgi:hypothetical protein
MPPFSTRAIEFYSGLKINSDLPRGIEVLDPYKNPEVQSVLKAFFQKYYHDGKKRQILFGINPGRFGAGVTGITFTDPLRLEEDCGIPNPFGNRQELSSRFVYEVIRVMGGPAQFFERFFLSAVSPLGFIRSGRNLNYYDEPDLLDALQDFILTSVHRQLDLGILRDRVFSLGEGKNYRYLQKLNLEHGLFGEIVPLPHPRWVMQYRYKKRDQYLHSYVEALSGA